MAHSSAAPTLRYGTVPQGLGLGGRLLAWLISWLIGLLLLAALLGWRYDVAYQGRIFEGVAVNGIALGGMSPEQAMVALLERGATPGETRLVLQAADERWIADGADLGMRLDAALTVQAAYQRGRDGNLLQQWLERLSLWRGSGQAGRVEPVYTRSEGALDVLLARIANELARDPQDGALQIQGLSISATPARPGRYLDLEASRAALLQALERNERTVELVVQERAPFIIGAEEAAEKARALVSTPLVFSFEQPDYRLEGEQYVATTEHRQWMVDRARLAEMLHIFGRQTESGEQYILDIRLKPELLREDLERVAATIDREPREARFHYDPNSGALTPMVVSQDGLELDIDGTMASIQEALEAGEHEVELVVKVTPPEVSTADGTKLNISGLAVQGFSDYTGSAYEREVNIGVAAQQYHGIVIPPGGVFSFNEHLGWVVDANGYEEGYIISGNRTEVDVGGGVCQVSTTVFRAAFYAGFEIVERHPHAYRVPYYENGTPMGFDATIFSPYVDLKFRNNTENYYLMQVDHNPNANTLAINLYGPPTGREVEMRSTVLERVPHGPPIYEVDPTLPPGVTKQVDWEHDGATVRVDRIIRDMNGNEIGRESFWSKYRPWQARYLVGPGGGPPQSTESESGGEPATEEVPAEGAPVEEAPGESAPPGDA